jgi:hypothetical protein
MDSTDKFDYLGGVPEDTWRATVAYLDNTDGARLARTSRGLAEFVDGAFWRSRWETFSLARHWLSLASSRRLVPA